MAHYGRLGNYQFPDAAEDIRGATLYGLNDDKLGKIDDVIFDHSSGNIGYVVVDTGGWLKSKKFIVPAERLRPASRHEDDFASDLTKQQVESFPPYNESDLNSQEGWADYEVRYRSKWEASPVMHRAETDRNITPTTQQLQGNQSSLRAEGARVPETSRQSFREEPLTEKGTSPSRIVPAGTDAVIIDNSAVGIGGRWDTFQARLRERRKEAVAGCGTCTVGPASTKGSESADTFKKAV